MISRTCWPCEQTSDELTDTPPGSHEYEEPLMFGWQVLQEDGSVKDQVTTSTEGRH
jgi:hypothetical protein